MPSRITGRKLRVNADGEATPAYRYSWGSHLPAGLMPKLKPQHATDPAAGMVRMTTGPKSSAYLTFRTMSENSPAESWILQAKPGQFILRDIASREQSAFPARIADVIRKFGA
jgi:hypothetical protein